MMKAVTTLFLVFFITGCSHIPQKILPPMYEKRAPFIIGVLSSKKNTQTKIDSLLINIIEKSKIASGVIDEPFDKEMVDVLMEVKNISFRRKSEGIFPKRWKIEGKLSIALFEQDGKLLKTYSAEAAREGKTINPFSKNYEKDLLFSELITNILDEVSSDFESSAIKTHHKIFKEKKVSSSNVVIHYPSLTDFRRRVLSVEALLRGQVPPEKVQIVLRKKHRLTEAPLITQEICFEQLKNVSGQKLWLYRDEVNNKKIPFNTLIDYSIHSSDIMGNEDTLSTGEIRFISKGLFRVKQAEVLTQGVIITSFGGLTLLMLLYSL